MANQSMARDVFMYLLVLVVLTMSSIAFGALLFDFVNIYMPDPIHPTCAYDGCANAVNGEVAVLLVAFPVLVWALRFVRRDVDAHPEKAEMWVRRWLLYLALFVSGIAAIIDVITLVTSWLNGELTFQFALKVAAVLLIAGAIFYYFLRELHPARAGKQRFVAWLVMGAVVAALVGGVYTSAPWLARDRANDRDRVFALQDVQSRIVAYWQNNQKLPDSLTRLQDPVGVPLPKDPESAAGHAGYEYLPTGPLSFSLCAVFTTGSLGGSDTGTTRPVAVYGPDENWLHGAGRVCFERSIDPNLYPPTKR